MLSVLKQGARRIRPLVACVRFARDVADPLRRKARAVERRQADCLMQPFTTTREDRHPELFDTIRQELQSIERPRILSYGCSTGEEAFTLARYMPGASITGVDINPACISVARKRQQKLRITTIELMVVPRPDVLPPASFDAIVCLSVLRHGRLAAETPDVCSTIMPFAKYDNFIRGLDHLLRPDGLLALWGCNFSFSDTSTSASYVMLATRRHRRSEPRYGRDDRMVCMTNKEDCLFRKTERAALKICGQSDGIPSRA